MTNWAKVPDALAEQMPAVARALFGDPIRSSRRRANRSATGGRKGSLAIDERLGVWFDHENGAGGGVLDLIKREKGLTDREAFDWMATIGCQLRPQSQQA